tara:strand:+ start:186 stop:380 length:195 start_codon:yes stop_codon:yes gene_type:complete
VVVVDHKMVDQVVEVDMFQIVHLTQLEMVVQYLALQHYLADKVIMVELLVQHLTVVVAVVEQVV